MFRVGLTKDFRRADGSAAFDDIDTTRLDVPGVEIVQLIEGDPGEPLPASIGSDLDAVVVLGPAVTADTLAAADRLALVARIGVGYDAVDLAACTRAGVALTITPEGVRRPVASAALAFLLALAHRLPAKDRLAREGRWGDKTRHMGIGLRRRCLGLVGLGNIGREIVHLVAPHDMHLVAADPALTDDDAAALGVQRLALDELLSTADFVVICCALTQATHHLIDAASLARMKPSAHLINVARGPLVDQAALTAALQDGRIAGAALDVFEQEPPAPDDPLLGLDNVILAPHALSWTDESFRLMGESAFDGVVAVAAGRAPDHIVNAHVIDTDRFRHKLAACARRREAAAP